jgi:NADH-quinone oxidoreductase subunit I
VAAQPVTVAYPREREARPTGARGSVAFLAERCTACLRCVSACPTSCLQIDGDESAVPPATLRAVALDRGACIVCGACIDACPTGALLWSASDELAAVRRGDLVADAAALRPAPEELP